MAAFATAARADRIVLVAGGGNGTDGPAQEAMLKMPFGVDSDRAGNLYLVEYQGQRVRKVDAKGMLSTVAGTGQKGSGGDGGPALQAQFSGMHSLAIAANGDIYIADTENSRVRMIDPRTGTVANFAGTGNPKGFGGDGGPAGQARFGNIYSVAFDPQGRYMVLADLDNRRVRKIDMKTRIVTTVAGNGQRGVPKDGADAAQAPLVDPRAAAADADGNVYVLERSGNALRVVDRSGKIRTVVGASGKKGAEGDGGDASKATMNGPKHLCVDRDGSVLIADTENHLIRRYLPKDGKIVRVAGSGKRGTAGLGGPPEQAELNQPHGVHVDPAGTLFIADSTNNRVLKIER
jgi:DNA-binding beta-propeller fold protein YncE